MATLTRDELLAIGTNWFDKLYRSKSPIYHQINATRPNSAPDFEPEELIDRVEKNVEDRIVQLEKAVDQLSKARQ